MASKSTTLVFILLYMITSSQMLLLNKAALRKVQLPNFLLFLQLSFSAITVKGLAALNTVSVDSIERRKAYAFAPAVVFFFLGLLTNFMAINRLPIDTFICARAAVPLALSILEMALLGRELPSRRSVFGMILIVGGAVNYVRADTHFDPAGYAWLFAWYLNSLCEMLFVKHLVSTVEMTAWGRALYQNGMAAPAFLVMVVFTGEHKFMAVTSSWTLHSFCMVFASCVAGLAMSYLSFVVRSLVSATTFSVLGNVCKLLTIATNLVIWDEHASGSGILAVLVSLAGAAIYQQAPMRSAENGLT